MKSRATDFHRKDQRQPRQENAYSYQQNEKIVRQQHQVQAQSQQPFEMVSISKQLHSFLMKCRAMGKGQTINTRGDLVTLDGHTSANFLNGILVAMALPQICGGLGIPLPPIREHLAGLQSGSAPQVRLNNYNIILSVLDRALGMRINNDAKALLVAGDKDTIIKLYEGFRRRCMLGNRARPANNPAGRAAVSGIADGATAGNAAGNAAVIAKMIHSERAVEQIEADPHVLPTVAKSPIELVIITMCQSLSIRPDQAIALLSTNAHYLGHMFSRGVNNSYDTIIKWCQQLLTHVQHMCTLVRKNVAVIPMVMHTLRLGMFSQNHVVSSLVINLFGAMAEKLESSMCREALWKWFVFGPGGVGVNTGLHGILAALHTHSCASSDVRPAVWKCLKNVVSGPSDAPISSRTKTNSRGIAALLCKHLREMLPEPILYMNTVSEILTGMLPLGNEVLDAMESEGAARQLIEYTLAHADTERLTEEQSMFKAAEQNLNIKSCRERIAALELNVQLWVTFPEIFDDIPQASRLALSLLKKGVMDEFVELQIASVTLLFHLLDSLADRRHPFAPYLYKSLIFALIGSADNEVLHEYLLFNMIDTLNKFSNIPVGVLVDPLVKQMAKEGYNNLLFDLYVAISKHDRLDIEPALKLANILGQIALNDPIFGRLASVPFMNIIQSFPDSSNKVTVMEYVKKFFKLSLKSFLSLELGILKSNLEEETLELQSLPLECMGKILEFGRKNFTPKVSESIEQMLSSAAKHYADITGGKHHPGLAMLISIAANICLTQSADDETPMQESEGDAAVMKTESMSVEHVFRMVDKNKDGFISKEDLIKSVSEDSAVLQVIKTTPLLHPLLYPNHWELSFDAMDPSSGNGDVDLEWFVTFVHDVHQTSISTDGKLIRTDTVKPLDPILSPTAKANTENLSFGADIENAMQGLKTKMTQVKALVMNEPSISPEQTRTPSPGPAYAFRTPPAGKGRKRSQTQGAFIRASEWQYSKASQKRQNGKREKPKRKKVRKSSISSTFSANSAFGASTTITEFEGVSGDEETDLEAASTMFSRWGRQMKHAYDSYAESRVTRDNDAVTFDHMKAGRSFLKFKHWMVMLRDYDIIPAYVKPQALKLIWNKVCFGRLQTIDYRHFLLCMRILILYHDGTKYSSERRNKYATTIGRPESRGVDGLLGHMSSAAVERYSLWHSRVWQNERDDVKMPKGCEPSIWCPKNVSPEKIKRLNATLQHDENAEVPAGFLKQYKTVLLIPESFDNLKSADGSMKESALISIQILQDIVRKQFGFSILGAETRTEVSINTRALENSKNLLSLNKRAKSHTVRQSQHKKVSLDSIVPASELDEIQLELRRKWEAHPKVASPSKRLYSKSSKNKLLKGQEELLQKVVSFGSSVSKIDPLSKISPTKSPMLKEIPPVCDRLYPYSKKITDTVVEEESSKKKKKKKKGQTNVSESPEKEDTHASLPTHLQPVKAYKTRKAEEEKANQEKKKRDARRREKRQEKLRGLIAQKAQEKAVLEEQKESQVAFMAEKSALQKQQERDNRIREKRRIMKWKEKKLRKKAEERAQKLQEKLERQEESNDAILIKAERARRAALRIKQKKEDEEYEKERVVEEKNEAAELKRNAMADAARRRVAERSAMVEKLASMESVEGAI
jgi:hypothetical protein